jgi:hypothetical protein
MSGSTLSFAATFDGSTPSIPLTWVGADPNHIVLFNTVPVAGFANVVPSLTSHTSTGGSINMPPGWQGVVTVTLLQGLGSIWGLPIIAAGRATFAGTNSALLTWSKPLPDSGYIVIIGLPVITDGKGAVTITAGVSNKQKGTLQMDATANFAGYVDVLACQPGADVSKGISV